MPAMSIIQTAVHCNTDLQGGTKTWATGQCETKW